MVLKSRPVVTMAGVSQMLEGRMAEWLRPRVFIAENGLNIRRISVGSKSCPSKKTIGVFIAENGLNIRRISVGSKSCSSRKITGWADGAKTTQPVVTMASVSRYFWGQDGRLVNAPSLHCRDRTKYTPDKRGIEILSLKKDHRLGGWR